MSVVLMQIREFQQSAGERLKKGQSVLIIAPTGLGKTRAALKPFVNENNTLLTTRLIYNLPLRALAIGVVNELKELSSKIQPTIHHGDEPESRFFSERAVITTVDQYFTAFAGAPLSWASHLSHAAAGAVLTSYSVFDEVHLLSPKTGLQLLFAILRLRQRWGLLSCVMTATMPESTIKFFKEFCGLEVEEATDKDIGERDSWRKVSLRLLGERKTLNSEIKKGRKKSEGSVFEWDEKNPQGIAELVKEKWGGWNNLDIDGPRKIIVFVNTVDRSIEVYRYLKGVCPNIILAHSRFTREHRKHVEERVQQFFGKDAQNVEAILVTTQVAEAGLNISAPLVITELCLMDSLIQRIGRCQRFKLNDDQEMQGLVLVVKPKTEGKAKWYVPYIDYVFVKKESKSSKIHIIEVSRYVLEERFANPGLLDWNNEKDMINDALSDFYSAFLKGLDRLEYDDVKDKRVGKVYKRLEKIKPEEVETVEEEHGKETESEE